MENESLANKFLKISQEAFPNGTPWKKTQILSCLENDKCFFFTVEEKKQTVGFILFSLVCEEAEILLIAITRKRQRAGLGQLLLKKSFTYLIENKAKTIFIEVRKSNLMAQQFYLKNDFKKIAIRRNYYKNPKEDALIYKLLL